MRPKIRRLGGKYKHRSLSVATLIGTGLAMLAGLMVACEQPAAAAEAAVVSGPSAGTGGEAQAVGANASFVDLAAVLPLGGRGGGQSNGAVGGGNAAQPAAGSGAAHGANGRNYPYASVPYPSNSLDPWGMYKRECVSYAAWKVAASGRHMPYWGGRGSAKLWDDNARAAGIPVGTVPQPGDVAIRNSGTYGHAMYVESVNGDGTINISQYNGRYDGAYSERTVGAAGLVFVRF